MSKPVAKNFHQRIKNVLNLCQESPQSHKRLLCELQEIYGQMDFKDFFKDFLELLRYFLVKFDPSTYVDSCLLFVAKFALSVPKDEDDDDDDVSDFVKILFDFLLKIHNVQDKGVRLRCCHLMFLLLSEMIHVDNANLSEATWQRLLKAFIERAKDKAPRVRVQAVQGLGKLQDTEDKSCPAMTALMFLMRYDPSPDVRSEAARRVMVNNITLPKVVESTLDESDFVRRNIFLLIATKIPPKYLSIKQRCDLLHNGLSDHQEIVRKACQQKLLPAWLTFFDNDILELLYRIDLVNCEKTAEMTLQAYFDGQNLAKMVDKFKDSLDEKLLLTDLTSAKTFYWRFLVKYIKDKSNKSPDNINLLDMLDRVMPALSDLSKFVSNYIENHYADAKQDVNKLVEYEFISLQFLGLVEFFDRQDEAGRRVLKEDLEGLIGSINTDPKFLPPLIRLLFCIEKTEKNIKWLAEIISDFYQPFTDLTARPMDEDDGEVVFNVKNVEIERNDSSTFIQCLTIIAEALQQPQVKVLTPVLRSMLDNLVLTCIRNEDPAVRNLAFRCLGLCCLLDRNLATKYFVIIFQALQVDVEGVRKTLMQAIFDLLTIHGASVISSNGVNDKDTEKKNPADGILKVLTRLLENEQNELKSIAAEGLSKLLYHQRFYAPLLLSRLILMWYNPISKGCPSLRRCIGAFLPLFAYQKLTNQEALEEAFIPTLRTIFNSPVNHPLSKVDAEHVAMFMVHLTSWNYLSKRAPGKQDGNVHASLAIKICNEILNDCQSSGVKVLAKVLGSLSLKPNVGLAMLKDVQNLVSDLCERVKERWALKYLKTFSVSVNSLVSATEKNLPTIKEENEESRRG